MQTCFPHLEPGFKIKDKFSTYWEDFSQVPHSMMWKEKKEVVSENCN